MDAFTLADVNTLNDARRRPCVSLFMPTHRTGRELRQDPIRLKNLLRDAEEQLVAGGLRTPEARELLRPAQQLLDESLFWAHMSDGLALFLGPEVHRRYRVPLPLEEQVAVADRFHVKPLLPLLTGDGHFFILGLSQKSVRLLEATRHSVDEIELESMPTSLAEALRFDDLEKQLQFHTRAPERGDERAAMFFGQGPGGEVEKERLVRYFRQVDRGVCELLHGEQAPLVLAGVDYYFPLYREANNYAHLFPEGVSGNPEGLLAEELHRRAWPLVAEYFQRAEDQALAQYRQLAGTGRTSVDLPEILHAAHQGRVETLFVVQGIQQWGDFAPERQQVEFHAEPGPGSQELLDLAAIRALAAKGSVFVLDRSRMPESGIVAAIYRY